MLQELKQVEDKIDPAVREEQQKQEAGKKVQEELIKI
jgi:hypothetical protein